MMRTNSVMETRQLGYAAHRESWNVRSELLKRRDNEVTE
jgi:hypothetical protein